MMKKSNSILLRKLCGLLNQEVRDNQRNLHAYNRREFLLKSTKVGIAIAITTTIPSFLLSCKDNKKQGDTDEDILDVAIIGAGIAGLNCANHLLKTSLNFKIFEADRRIGGRILTHYNDPLGIGVYPEFGGDFIDSNHQDMLSLAKEFNLELVDLIKEQEENRWTKDVFYFDGRKISEEEIIKEFKKTAPKISVDIASLGEDYQTDAAKILDNMPLSDYIHSLPCAAWLKDLFTAAWVAEYGLDCAELSTINMLDMINTSTEDGFEVFGSSDERYRIKGGNSKIVEALAKKIGTDKIEKNFEVSEITEREDGTYLISFKNKEAVRARSIVCTIPFTILRELKLNLKNIDAAKRRCIDELGYGKNTKLVLAYEGQPWRSKENHAMGYLFTNDITNGWDGSVNKAPGSTHGAYVAYFGGEFSQKLSDSSFKNPMAPPTHSWRTELPAEKVNAFVNELENIFPGSKEKFLGKHIFVNWLDYPFAKASYSCYKVGQWTSIAGQEMKPIGNFFFAGEHCSQLFQGFMNGAAETGRRVAQMLRTAQAKTADVNAM